MTSKASLTLTEIDSVSPTRCWRVLTSAPTGILHGGGGVLLTISDDHTLQED